MTMENIDNRIDIKSMTIDELEELLEIGRAHV